MSEKINVYTCPKGHKTISIDRVEGTTPFMISCIKCGEMSNSCFYSCDQTLIPEIEWIKPDDDKHLDKIVVEMAKRHKDNFNMLLILI